MVRKTPILGAAARAFGRWWKAATFPGSRDYWITRYQAGGGSGDGSYGPLAEFKAEVVNALVEREGITSVIEYGCGDGNQLTLARYPVYLGFDVSPVAVDACRALFGSDDSKSFALSDQYAGETADLTLSLDVIYHLIEDSIFDDYMSRLFASSRRFVIIYSSDTDQNPRTQAPHVRHRRFTAWIEEHAPDWRLKSHVPNRFPFTDDSKAGSLADFYIYEKAEQLGDKRHRVQP